VEGLESVHVENCEGFVKIAEEAKANGTAFGLIFGSLDSYSYFGGRPTCCVHLCRVLIDHAT
jgi:hypothetical protein